MICHDEVMQRGVATGAGPNTPHGGELKGKMLTEKSEIDAAVAACNGVTMELSHRLVYAEGNEVVVVGISAHQEVDFDDPSGSS